MTKTIDITEIKHKVIAKLKPSGWDKVLKSFIFSNDFDNIIKQLIKFPNLYYAKSSFPLEISQRAFDQLWRMCESYELWCKETNQSDKLLLKIVK